MQRCDVAVRRKIIKYKTNRDMSFYKQVVCTGQYYNSKTMKREECKNTKPCRFFNQNASYMVANNGAEYVLIKDVKMFRECKNYRIEDKSTLKVSK